MFLGQFFNPYPNPCLTINYSPSNWSLMTDSEGDCVSLFLLELNCMRKCLDNSLVLITQQVSFLNFLWSIENIK